MSAKILVVDDTETIARIVRAYLESAGYQVQTAADGPAALRLVEEWPPDLVLLDVNMPEMDGFDVCARLRRLGVTATVPIIMLTAQSTLEDKTKGFEAGADDYITKPVEAAELKMRVAAQLRRRKMTLAASESARPACKVITVFSLRGGSGCTSLAVNLAVGLAKLWGTPVPLLDFALPVGVCDAMLNLRPKYRLDNLAGRPLEELDTDVLDGSLTLHESGVKLLGGFEDAVMAEQLSEGLPPHILEHLRSRFPYVVIDTSHAFSPPIVAALDQSDVIVMPIPPDLNSVRLGVAALKVFAALKLTQELILIVNWTFAKRGIARQQAEKFLNQPVQFVIPYAESAWSNAINTGQPLLLGEPESPLAALVEDMAWRVSDARVRQEKPAQPTEMWQRVTQRREAQSQAKTEARP